MKIVKCDRCGADISSQFSAVSGVPTTKRKLAIMRIPDELLPIPEQNASSIVDLCEKCDNQIYNEIFVHRNEITPEKSDDAG